MLNLKRCALLCRMRSIFSVQAQLADENGSQQIEEISVIGQFVPDEKRSTDALPTWLTPKSSLALVTLILLRASRGGGSFHSGR